jgi:hypothetical protein
MLARTLKMLPTLLENIRVFSAVGSRVLGGRRNADQIAPMCAGAWLCYSDQPVTPERAEAWIREKSWSAHTTIDSGDSWADLIEHISSSQIHVASSSGAQRRITIAELIRWDALDEIPRNEKGDPAEPIDKRDIHRQLLAHGICVKGQIVFVANRNANMARLLQATPWFKSWKDELKRVPRAVVAENPMRLGEAKASRGIELPLSTFQPPKPIPADFDGSSDMPDEQFGE